MFRRMRKLFSNAAEYDGDRPRDPYMDVLREIQRPAPRQQSGLRDVLARLTNARARANDSLRK
jgi:hypothetical protein